jgi:hypothetical protein
MRAGRGGIQQADPIQAGDVTVDGQLSEADALGIKYLREEEKLARDVYLTLGETWGAPIFANIAQAESRHMAAVAQLIDNYGLDDPVGENGRGVFDDPVLAGLYGQLVAEGSKSLEDAYKVGATIEELDINDLRTASAENADVERLYEVLESGSSNHLRAFDARIEAAGETYEAKYLSQTEYDAIADSAMARGNGQGAQGQRDQHGQRGQQGRSRAGGQLGDIGELHHRLGRSDVGQAGRRAQGGDGECGGEPDRDRDRMPQNGQACDAPQQTRNHVRTPRNGNVDSDSRQRDRDRTQQDGEVCDDTQQTRDRHRTPQDSVDDPRQAIIRDLLFANLGSQRGARRI